MPFSENTCPSEVCRVSEEIGGKGQAVTRKGYQERLKVPDRRRLLVLIIVLATPPPAAANIHAW